MLLVLGELSEPNGLPTIGDASQVLCLGRSHGLDADERRSSRTESGRRRYYRGPQLLACECKVQHVAVRKIVKCTETKDDQRNNLNAII
jgi:hypothetical protein